MTILPAIDLLGGKCVRLIQGSFDKEIVYDDDPVAVAKRWESMGATHLHVVDLDGAREGRPINDSLVQKIASSVSMVVEIGGGIRTEDDVRRYLEVGVHRVILGTAAVMNRILLRLLLEEHREHLVIGIDAREGKVSISAWQKDTTILATDLATQLVSLGCSRFIFTDISRDGMLTGPNLESLTDFAQATNVPVIASGGVSSLQDLQALKQLESVGVEGVIIGKALYDGRLDLREAVALCQ
ncbi:MAG: 1-(5-phosphoribosyl)-5-[(5-phosphoribosylamino)methylideneamino]imidazole-4-carboxamide isomerase [Armatimonadetes bacterium]|nr:1-(5-phosphoribosyl)-5-[(5-phosphoribosylamino)methylideneamino]imidazole-4-carboxamide isomerase [Armatimonadota bacterium]